MRVQRVQCRIGWPPPGVAMLSASARLGTRHSPVTNPLRTLRARWSFVHQITRGRTARRNASRSKSSLSPCSTKRPTRCLPPPLAPARRDPPHPHPLSPSTISRPPARLRRARAHPRRAPDRSRRRKGSAEADLFVVYPCCGRTQSSRRTRCDVAAGEPLRIRPLLRDGHGAAGGLRRPRHRNAQQGARGLQRHDLRIRADRWPLYVACTLAL
jgi:hypothetical protein